MSTGRVLTDVPLHLIVDLLGPKDCVSLSLVSRAIRSMVGETIPGKFLQEYAPGMRTRTFSELFHVAAMYDQRGKIANIAAALI